MTPKKGDYSINLPITFDYKGGRSQGKKGRIIFSLLLVLITLIITIGVARNDELELYQRVLIPLAVVYVGLFILRYFIFRELWFSDVYETLKATDYNLPIESFWQIFDIDDNYPYISYFKNGYKGVFVRMEKDAITGKPEDAMFDHYEAIGDAYNIAHSLNMNIVHIDYMDNVGNDPRLEDMNNSLIFIENPDMQTMMADIYSNLQEEMKSRYSSFDVYLFMTKDKTTDFIYNIQSVCGQMLGGNYITYKVLNKYEIARVCSSLFNLEEFSIVDAFETTLKGLVSHGIRPISVTHEDGTVDIINRTMEEQRAYNIAQAKEQAELQAQKKKSKKKKQVNEQSKIDNTEIDLF